MAQRTPRPNRLEIRLTGDERAQIEARARASGLTMSRYMRHAALGLDLPRPRVNVEVEAVAALNRIGVNLNQLARSANRSGRLDPDQQQQLARAIEKMTATAARITAEEGTDT